MQYFILLAPLLVCSFTLATECVRKIIPSSHGVGNITSPGYPGPYPPNTCIMWFVFDRHSHLHVSIRIIDLNLPYPVGDKQCSTNSLSFGPLMPHRYCGKVRNEVYEADQERGFFVLFNTSSFESSGTGFFLSYTFSTGTSKSSIDIVPEIPKKPTIAATTPPMPEGNTTSSKSPPHSCSTVINTDKGQITLYPSHLNSMIGVWRCTWLLAAKTFPRNGYSVYMLHFASIQLHQGSYLDVYGGSSDLGQFYKRFSHDSQGPKEVEIVGGAAFLRLTIPAALLSQGFMGNFSLEFERRVECLVDYKHCGSNESGCYYFEKRCDGVWDCPASGGDERGCFYKCPGSKFSCQDKSGFCYSYADRCNGKVTCINYRDEMDCSPEMCSPSKGLFLCKNRRCIYEKWSCDGTDDCADGSDEEECKSWISPRVIMAAVVGSVLCSLLVVVALSFACRVYALRHHRYRGERGHETPLSRVEAELLRRRPPPPPYSEAMITSRPYEEAYLELLNNVNNNNSMGLTSVGDEASCQNNEQQTTSSSSSSLQHVNDGSTDSHHRQRDGPGGGSRRRHRRRQHHRHHRNRNLGSASGLLTSPSQQCQLLLHRAGLAPPPYSLIDESHEQDCSSSDSEEEDRIDGFEGVDALCQTRGNGDESASVDISSLSSFETSPGNNHYHRSPLTLARELNTIALVGNGDGIENPPGTGESGDLRLENCDKEESDDTSEASDATVDTDIADTSLSFSNANTDSRGDSGSGAKPEDKEDQDRDAEDSDDCACILAEGNDAADESRIDENGLDSVCILSEQ